MFRPCCVFCGPVQASSTRACDGTATAGPRLDQYFRGRSRWLDIGCYGKELTEYTKTPRCRPPMMN
ncbi:exported hypothetical protein [Parafrankia sp. Ea1.12]|nr:exported hypothetical protein [Parafrankia sp. Ea1.12]